MKQYLIVNWITGDTDMCRSLASVQSYLAKLSLSFTKDSVPRCLKSGDIVVYEVRKELKFKVSFSLETSKD